MTSGKTDWITRLGEDKGRLPVDAAGGGRLEGEPLNARVTELLNVDLGESPECFVTASRGRFFFVLVRNRETKRTVLHRFDLQRDFKHTVLETSDDFRPLATCTEMSVRELAGSDGFMLNVYGTGELKNAKGKVVERLSKGFWMKDSGGNGQMDIGPEVGGPTSWRRINSQKFENPKSK